MNINVQTYNTHLFGKAITSALSLPELLAVIVGGVDPAEAALILDYYRGLGWHDDDRFNALKALIEDDSVCTADIIAIQEMWSSDFVNNIKSHSVGAIFTNHWDHEKGAGSGTLPSNGCGLLLLGRKLNVTFDTKNAEYFDYIHAFGADNFDKTQDSVTAKGYLKLPVTVGDFGFTLITTHMPTGAGHYRSALDKCFQALAQAASSATGPVLLMGDFNIDETKLDDSMKSAADPDGVPFYDEWIGPNGYLGKAGLVDAYRRLYGDSKNDPGYTVVSSTNSCWQHFNPEDVAKGTIDNQRIDYMMCRGLTPVSVAVGSDKKWVWKDSDGHTKDISDHYPLLGTFTLGT